LLPRRVTYHVVVDQFSDDTQARARFSFRISSNQTSCSSTPASFSVRRRRGSTRGRRNTGRGRRCRRSSTYFPSQADAIAALSSWAAVADEWFTTNRVKCNIEKTIMMFAAPNQSCVKPMSLQVGASSLLPSSECRHLGVVIDAQLTLASHIRAVCKSARYHLWRISKIRRYLDVESAKCLVHSLVLSRLDMRTPSSLA
jgi:hypothetical protein